MAFRLDDRVKETSTTAGTGAFALDAAMTGYIRFSGIASIAVGDTLPYCIQAVDAGGSPSGDWEVGLGTYSAANTLTRTTILASSNAGAAVNFAAGTKQVFLTVTATMAAWPRERLTAARTYYVRTDGSDSNTGLANTAGGAFLTIQKAVDVIASTLDISIYDVTIQVADGTYTTPVLGKQCVGGGKVIIVGNSGTPSNVLVSTTSSNGITVAPMCTTVYDARDLKLQTTTSGSCLVSGRGSRLIGTRVVFGASAGFHCNASGAGNIELVGPYSITGGASAHWYTGFDGFITAISTTITLTGTPAITTFALADRPLGTMNVFGNTFSGSATGTRYSITSNSAVFVNGAASTYLPGDVAGATATGGQYI